MLKITHRSLSTQKFEILFDLINSVLYCLLTSRVSQNNNNLLIIYKKFSYF